MGASLQAKARSIINLGAWQWPKGRNPIIQRIIDQTPIGFLPNIEIPDLVVWNLNVGGDFITTFAWNALSILNL